MTEILLVIEVANWNGISVSASDHSDNRAVCHGQRMEEYYYLSGRKMWRSISIYSMRGGVEFVRPSVVNKGTKWVDKGHIGSFAE